LKYASSLKSRNKSNIKLKFINEEEKESYNKGFLSTYKCEENSKSQQESKKNSGKGKRNEFTPLKEIKDSVDRVRPPPIFHGDQLIKIIKKIGGKHNYKLER
jgi:hypothetical protein